MARYSYTYKSFPNCPEATEYSKKREESGVHLTMLGGWLSLGAVINFLIVTFQFFGTYKWGDFLGAVAFVLFVAIYDFYIMVIRNNKTECELKIILLNAENREQPISYTEEYCKKIRENNRKQNIRLTIIVFSWVLCAVVALIALIGFVKAIYFICHKQDGVYLLVLSILALIVTGIALWKLNRQRARNTVNDEQHKGNCCTNKMPDQSRAFFCRYCGMQIPNDSVFCSKCGKKVKLEE